MNEISHTRNWIESIVIGLNLCPFAKGVVHQEKVRYRISLANRYEDLLEDLLNEIQFLLDNEPEEVETSVIIHPNALTDFEDYLGFLDLAEEILEEGELEDMIQIAGFHPDYLFADSDTHDPANYTNRSPYPMLHLLRAQSLESAIEAYGDTSAIPERNIELMRDLGLEKVRQMRKDCMEVRKS